MHFDLPAALPLPFAQHDRLYWAEAMLDLPCDAPCALRVGGRESRIKLMALAPPAAPRTYDI